MWSPGRQIAVLLRKYWGTTFQPIQRLPNSVQPFQRVWISSGCHTLWFNGVREPRFLMSTGNDLDATIVQIWPQCFGGSSRRVFNTISRWRPNSDVVARFSFGLTLSKENQNQFDQERKTKHTHTIGVCPHIAGST